LSHNLEIAIVGRAPQKASYATLSSDCLIINSLPLLSTACFLNCFNNDSSCFFAGEIRHCQVRDGLPSAHFFCVDHDFRNLNGYPWRFPINDFNPKSGVKVIVFKA
jgi:hypothetical protein